MIQDSHFVFNYVPLKYAAEMFGVGVDDIILESMMGAVNLYAVNQSHKALAYAPMSYRKGWSQYKHLIRLNYKHLGYKKGEMIQLKSMSQLDDLAKGILTENELFLIHPEGGYYLVGSIYPLWRWTTPNFLINKFHPITLDHVFILLSEIPTLKEALLAAKALDEGEEAPTEGEKLTKQGQRELIFLAWLSDKDEHEVSLMKKEDVLEALRKIDPHLFMGEQKHFFRRQKRITFKSGRKAEIDD